MSFVDFDSTFLSRARSYELTRRTLSMYITKDELEDAKKEIKEIRRKITDLNEEIRAGIKERDERISSDELAMLMQPVEELKRREDELSDQIRYAKIVEKASKVLQEDIEDVIAQNPEESNLDESKPIHVYFIKDDIKVDAKPGDRTPFYALINEEYIGYNRLILNGWLLVDESGNEIPEDRINTLNRKLRTQERANWINATRIKYPNAFNQWTDSENGQLLHLYGEQGKTVEETAKELGRTQRGVSLQLRKLLGVEHLNTIKKEISLETYSQNPLSITTIDPSEIPDTEMPGYLEKIEHMEKWFKAVRQYAEQQVIEDGVLYEGYEIKTTTKNSFSNTSQVYEIIHTQYPDLLKDCVQIKPVSSIKKVLGEEKYNESIAGLVTCEEKMSLIKSKK